MLHTWHAVCLQSSHDRSLYTSSSVPSWVHGHGVTMCGSTVFSITVLFRAAVLYS